MDISFVNSNNSILLVWDVNRALLSSVYNPGEIKDNISKLVELFRNKQIPIIFTNIIPYPKGFESYSSKFMKFSGNLSTQDWSLAITPAINEIVINKNTWSLFVGTNAELLIKNSGRMNLIITGIATEIGVETTARHAFALGILPIIVEDAVSSNNKEAHERSIENMKLFFPVVKTEEIVKLFS